MGIISFFNERTYRVYSVGRPCRVLFCFIYVLTIENTISSFLGQFPCLEMVFKMRRDLSMNTFEAGIFLSSTLLVLISWLGFWTPHGHQRVFLGLGTSLVFAILFVSVIAWRPYSFAEKTSTAQLWLTMCFAFSLGMVLEYALVYVLLGVIPAKLKRSFGKGGQGDNVDEVSSSILFGRVRKNRIESRTTGCVAICHRQALNYIEPFTNFCSINVRIMFTQYNNVFLVTFKVLFSPHAGTLG